MAVKEFSPRVEIQDAVLHVAAELFELKTEPQYGPRMSVYNRFVQTLDSYKKVQVNNDYFPDISIKAESVRGVFSGDLDITDATIHDAQQVVNIWLKKIKDIPTTYVHMDTETGLMCISDRGK